MFSEDYEEQRRSASQFITVRGLRYHVRAWGDPSLVSTRRPPLVMLHGWMDVSASFQFVVDALPSDRYVLALDWRGFGLTDSGRTDCYWFLDFIGDLEVALDALVQQQQVDLVGHSMGANIAMIYAGVRPQRVRKLVNLEGFGAPELDEGVAPLRYARWLDELKEPMALRASPTLEAVTSRLLRTNPALRPDRARWLARRWAAQNGQGEWDLLADPAHKRMNPLLHNPREVSAIWRRIEAPTIWVAGAQSPPREFWGNGRCSQEEYGQRLTSVNDLVKQVLSPAGHMVHHDQPEQLASVVDSFLSAH